MNSGPLTQSKRNNFTLIVYAVKFLISIGSLYLIYRKVFLGQQNKDYLQHLIEQIATPGSLSLIITVFILMIANWSIESIKWRFMIWRLEQVDFLLAFRAVLIGLTISFFTPNRIGEYAGRVSLLSPGNRIAGACITILENLGQLTVTLVAGFIALFFFKTSLPKFESAYGIINVVCIVMPVILLSLFLFMGKFLDLISHKKFIQKYASTLSSMEAYSPFDMLKLLLLSFFRYCIFSTQFYLLINLFGFHPDFFQSMMLITMTFFAMTVIPTIALTEISVRGAMAVYFFGFITYDTLPVLHASFAIWLINLVIPSVAGSLLILNSKWKIRN